MILTYWPLESLCLSEFLIVKTSKKNKTIVYQTTTGHCTFWTFLSENRVCHINNAIMTSACTCHEANVNK